ncbi:SufE family protein [Colwellia sp. MB3u-70]|uniref:SufE family protein n=1 Tax=unclassified Colwellia TaxID=196834 RepID=UPI0015F5F190|nr:MULTISPECIES: SufE family protein [unclassified Colwellia]MBA6293551.1 SufE family protein [Colwellia sp. MB3u-8]MBA6306049.1 SufE family protein [Colwellia sp. MB3u-70]
MNLPSSQEIIEDMAFFDDWEQRYQYIIDLGKSIPPIDESLKTNENLVRGCQSNVWLVSTERYGKLQFQADSDAVIVNGLLALVIAVFNDKTMAKILDFDINGYFKALDLERHITPTRGNGLHAIVAKIQAIAKTKM